VVLVEMSFELPPPIPSKRVFLPKVQKLPNKGEAPEPVEVVQRVSPPPVLVAPPPLPPQETATKQSKPTDQSSSDRPLLSRGKWVAAAVIAAASAYAVYQAVWTKQDVFKDPDYVAAQRALVNKDAVGALKLLNKLNEKHPNNAAILFQMGDAYDDLEWFSDAILSYESALKLEPNNATTWHHLALARAQSDNYEAAITAAMRAIKIEPDNYKAWCALGVIRLLMDQTSEAITALKQSVKINAEYAVGRNGLALAYLANGDIPNAVKAKRRVQALAPQPVASPAPIGEIDRNKAIEAFARRFVGALYYDSATVLASYGDQVDWRDKGVVDQNFIGKAYSAWKSKVLVPQYTIAGDAQISSGDSPDLRKVVVEYLFQETFDHGWGKPSTGSIGSATLEWQVATSGNDCKIRKERYEENRIDR
jgi:tetratricopeptide (TPR) repeat protein